MGFSARANGGGVAVDGLARHEVLLACRVRSHGRCTRHAGDRYEGLRAAARYVSSTPLGWPARPARACTACRRA
jgi:hypothetical protein